MIDFFALAVRSTRREFVSVCPFPFLVGRQALERPRSPRKTDVFDTVGDTTGATRVSELVDPESDPETLVLPVRKVQEAFASMITVGRTANHDVVIADVSMSRFHAYFRIHPNRVELADAGSINGTFVGLTRLEPKGPAHLVAPGETVKFAHLRFTFLDAGTCWDSLQAAEVE